MKCKTMLTIATAAAAVALLGGAAVFAQDQKYSLKVPGWTRVLRVQGLRGLGGDHHRPYGPVDEGHRRKPCGDGRPSVPAFPATANPSPMAPGWRR